MVNVNDYLPKRSEWFSEKGEYIGYGSATFESPEGTLSGPIRIVYDEEADFYLEMTIEKFDMKDQYPHYSVDMFLRGAKPSQQGTMTIYGIGTDRNECNKVSGTISTPFDGIFFSQSEEFQTQVIGDEGRVRFIPLGHKPELTVKVNSNSPPKYWCVPLVNYVGETRWYGDQLLKHPLRIVPPTEVPEGLSQEDMQWLKFQISASNRFIPFKWDGSLCFIENLPDFEQRKDSLVKESYYKLITSVAVGEIPNSLANMDFEDLFPEGLLELLGLSSGNKIGTCWFETRDQDGYLLIRQHANFGTSKFKHGQKPIHAHLGKNHLGEILTTYFDPSLLDKDAKDAVRRASREFSRCSLGGRDLAESLLNVCRALDILFKNHLDAKKVKNTSPISRLSPTVGSQAQTIIANAKKSLLNLRRRASVTDKDELQRIGDRLASMASGADGDFGSKAQELMQYYGLQDISALQGYFVARNLSWTSVASDLRNRMAHGGAFDISTSDKSKLSLAMAVHLADITARIILKLLNYSGTYYPLTQYAREEEVGWVNATTKPSELGYK